MKKISLLVILMLLPLASCSGVTDSSIEESSKEEFDGPATIVKFWRDYNQYSLIDEPYYSIRIPRASIIGAERKPADPLPIYDEWQTFMGWSTISIYDDIESVTFWNFETDSVPNQLDLDLFGIWTK